MARSSTLKLVSANAKRLRSAPSHSSSVKRLVIASAAEHANYHLCWTKRDAFVSADCLQMTVSPKSSTKKHVSATATSAAKNPSFWTKILASASAAVLMLNANLDTQSTQELASASLTASLRAAWKVSSGAKYSADASQSSKNKLKSVISELSRHEIWCNC